MGAHKQWLANLEPDSGLVHASTELHSMADAMEAAGYTDHAGRLRSVAREIDEELAPQFEAWIYSANPAIERAYRTEFGA